MFSPPLKKSIVFLKYALKMDLVKGEWFDLYIVKANDTGLEHTTISLEKLVDMSDGLTLTTMQEAIASKEATIRQVGISIIGVTLFLLLFSIITFASTIITNIATKKREYAMFQSIGMTSTKVFK